MLTDRVSRGGFTLMDILTAVVIIAAVTSVALPNASGFFATQQVSAQAGMLINDIRLARAWAIENQMYTRLVFAPATTSWVVQELVDGAGNQVQGDPTFAMTDAEKNGYDDVNPTFWRSLLDGPSREIDNEVALGITPVTRTFIFFRPDGMLVEGPSYSAFPIQTRRTTFAFGLAETYVDITPAGALETTEYYRDDYE